MLSIDRESTNPIVRTLVGCCARAASGHVAVAPPSKMMNSRRLIRSPRRASRVSRPSGEQRRPVHAFREIDQFRVNLHPGGLAVRPDVSDWLGPIYVVERAHAPHLDTGQPGGVFVPEPAMAMRTKVHADDI